MDLAADTTMPVVVDTSNIDKDDDETPDWVAKKYAYNPSATHLSDLVHTKLEVSFNWEKQQMRGLSTLRLKPHFYPQQSVVLDAVGFDVHSVKLLRKKKSLKLKYSYDSAKLSITLDTVYNRFQEYTIEIDYTANPERNHIKGSEAITSDKGLYFINPLGTDPEKPRQIWTQGETQANSRWMPTLDVPDQRCTQEMHITVDTAYKTLSNGTLTYSSLNENGTRTDVWEQKLPHAPYLFMMAVGKYTVVTDKWKGMEVSYYVEPKYGKHARAIFGNTPEMIGFFSDKLGVKYPWAKYSQVVVRDYVSGAMENSSATVMMEAVQSDDKQLADKNWDDIISHELFHQWFGDYVTCESWSNLPLNESFATYGEYLWNEYKYGLEEADFSSLSDLNNYINESRTKQEPLIRFYYNDREAMFDSHSYAKGGLTLHMLRKYVGDEAFFAALNLYLNTNKFKQVEIHNLRLAFEEVTGEDLNWFFNQWFMSAGHPQLEVRHSFASGKLSLSVKQLQDSAYTPIYRLPLSVDVWHGTVKTRHNITVTKAEQTFTFPAHQAPDNVLFDAEQQLVGLIDHEKTKAEYLHQMRHAGNVKARLSAMVRLKNEISAPEVISAYSACLSDKFWAVRDIAIEALASDSAALAANKVMLLSIAEADPKPSVRAEAIEALYTLHDKKLTPVFEKAMNAQSNQVNAAGLALYLLSDAKDKPAKIARFENANSNSVISVIAQYYVDSNKAGHTAWFEKRVKAATGDAQYAAIQLYGKYATHLSAPERAKAVDLFFSTARTSTSVAAKFGAFRALQLNRDVPGAADKLKEVKAKETNKTLLQYYEMAGSNN